MDFFCCLYNEHTTLFCCGLDYDTRLAIYERAKEMEMDPRNYSIDLNADEDDNGDNENP